MRSVIEELRSSLDFNNVDREDRGDMMNLLVAEAVGNALSIPSSPVENLTSYFRLHHRETVMGVLSEVNEKHVIDIDEVASLINKLWSMRYRMVHNPGHTTTKRLLGLMVQGGSFEIPPNVAKMASKYPKVCANRYLIGSTKEVLGEDVTDDQ